MSGERKTAPYEIEYIAVDYACESCGYNLKTRRVDSRCPECWSPVPRNYLTRTSKRTRLLVRSAWITSAVFLAGILTPLFSESRDHGCYRPTIENLSSPVPVNFWTQNSLALKDGRVIRLNELNGPIRAISMTMATAIQRGVEIGEDGRPIVLIPVGRSRYRVDLQHLLTYAAMTEKRQASNRGFLDWTRNDYDEFEDWSDVLKRVCARQVNHL